MRSPMGEIPLVRTEIGRHGAPSWAQRIVAEVASRYPGVRPPHVDFVPARSTSIYGGRYFPRLGSILVYETNDPHLNKGTLVHELAHWSSYVEQCGKPGGRTSCGYHGEHDGTFYRVLAPLYRHFDIAPQTRVTVEGTYSYPNSLLR